ncbi:hypothetical protein CJF42_14295 [Pseudoalteromonas sp. NBT06-2]|uniref:NnrS family protein n=1 Tax=Pseudoalteromonas sp. NBT06-2 TaxID=2025950 RepID=UPI000BA6DD7D|nr:NnrS family protein [Pseudoalteromonas sp. NBT06-2]PAJ73733.1 hypothetical protein CJF42_14295 [Pseudoalteromonas sp. NBT06-2]
MMEIQDPELMVLKYKQDNQSHSVVERNSFFSSIYQHDIFDLAFRPFFLLGSLASILSMIIWVLQLNSIISLNNSGLSPSIWHIHEMIFGFATTIAAGFILTAGKTWTKQPSLTGKNLCLLTLIWIAVRIAIYINTNSSIVVALLFQIVWWLVTILTFTKMVYLSKNKRNYLFVPLLSVMMIVNIAIILCDMINLTGLAMHLSRASILLFTILISIIAGRVIPFFTQNGAKTQKINTPIWIEKLILPVAITGVVVFILGYFFNLPFTPATIMLLAGLLHLLRLSFWKSTKTRNVPLLWSLHISYLFMGLGLILLGLSYFDLSFINISIPFSNALHMITIGAIGLMIFAMMSRVSLGHTGRALILNKMLILAFLLLILTALIRVILPLFNLTQLAWNLSALLWVSSGLIFIFVYSPILFEKRIDQ